MRGTYSVAFGISSGIPSPKPRFGTFVIEAPVCALTQLAETLEGRTRVVAECRHAFRFEHQTSRLPRLVQVPRAAQGRDKRRRHAHTRCQLVVKERRDDVRR